MFADMIFYFIVSEFSLYGSYRQNFQKTISPKIVLLNLIFIYSVWAGPHCIFNETKRINTLLYFGKERFLEKFPIGGKFFGEIEENFFGANNGRVPLYMVMVLH